MVDVTSKPWTRRRALARCRVTLGPRDVQPAGGDPYTASVSPGALSQVFAAARIAGIYAAKKTPGLVPLCHSLPLSGIELRLALLPDGVGIESEVTTTGPTGVEMEALTACVFAALTVVAQLGKTASDVSIDDLAVWEKSGGKSGHWKRPD